MKTKYYLGIIIAVLIALPIMGLLSMRVPGTNCIKVRVPGKTMIYSESGFATNYLADLHPNDVLYFCGDKNNDN